MKVKQKEGIEMSIKKQQVQVLTLEDYLFMNGVGFPISEHLLDKMKGNRQIKTVQGQKKFQQESCKAIETYHEKRAKMVLEYNKEVDRGNIRKPTIIEKSLITAQGHDDNASVQAARRMLAKRGIDWKTGQLLK